MRDVVDVRVSIEQTDGKITIADKGTMACRVIHPRVQPLSRADRHATLKLSGEGCKAEVQLDADAAEALARELAAVADGEVWADD